MPRTAHIQGVEVKESAEGRFIVETYDDGTVVRRRVEEGGKPRRKPRKPFARAWRPDDNPRS
jgi:hypothetical protein